MGILLCLCREEHLILQNTRDHAGETPALGQPLDPPNGPWPLALHGILLSDRSRPELADAPDPAADLPFVVVMVTPLVDHTSGQTFGTSLDAARLTARTPVGGKRHEPRGFGHKGLTVVRYA